MRFRRLRAALEGAPEDPPVVKRGELTALEKEFLPPVLEIQETPPSPIKRKLLWSIVLLVTALITWSYFGRIQVASTVSGKFVPNGKVKIIQPMETSVVRAIHVKDGQLVHRGDLLIELDPTISDANLADAQKRLAIAQEEASNDRPLVDSGALSRDDYLKVKQSLADAESDVAKAKKHLLFDSLRAPIDGVVQSVAVTTVGAVVTPAEPLVTIVPEGSALIVEAMLSNEDVGFVKVGQPVVIKVDTFPFEKYGTIRGKLVWISPDAEDKNQSAGLRSSAASNNDGGAVSPDSYSNANGGRYFYRIHIEPQRSTMRVDGQDVPLSAGMTVKADIVTDNRRVIEFFLSPVMKYLNEGMQVR